MNALVSIDPKHPVRNLVTVTGVHNYRPLQLRGAVTARSVRSSGCPAS